MTNSYSSHIHKKLWIGFVFVCSHWILVAQDTLRRDDQLDLLRQYQSDTSQIDYETKKAAIVVRNFKDIVKITIETNYLVFPINNSSESYLFEANLAPPLFIGNPLLLFDSTNKRSSWFRKWRIKNFHIALIPRTTFRMYQLESKPVTTPSYNPQVSLFYFPLLGRKRFKNYSFDEQYNIGISNLGVLLAAKVAHHSNGQAGPFYNEQGKHNYINGNFSTNYLELSYYMYSFHRKKNSFFMLGGTYQNHWGTQTGSALEIEPALNSRYGFDRFSLNFIYLNRFYAANKAYRYKEFLARIHSYYITDNDLSLLGSSSFGRRFSLQAEFMFQWWWLEDAMLLITLYQGHDYYNIRFDRRVTLIQFGVCQRISEGLLSPLRRK